MEKTMFFVMLFISVKNRVIEIVEPKGTPFAHEHGLDMD